jgi:hypothetical protein
MAIRRRIDAVFIVVRFSMCGCLSFAVFPAGGVLARGCPCEDVISQVNDIASDKLVGNGILARGTL